MISGITESSTESQGNYSCYISKSFVENSSKYNPAKYQSYVCFADADSTYGKFGVMFLIYDFEVLRTKNNVNANVDK